MGFLRIYFSPGSWAEKMGTPADGSPDSFRADSFRASREFHICRDVRDEYGLEEVLFSLTGNVILADFKQVRELVRKINSRSDPSVNPNPPAKRPPDGGVKAGQLNAMGLIDEILHYVVSLYRQQVRPDVFRAALARLDANLGQDRTEKLLRFFCERFPPRQVYAGKASASEYLDGSEDGESCRALGLEELLLLSLANLNPGYSPFKFFFDDKELEEKTVYQEAILELRLHLRDLPPFGPDGQNLWDMLRSPALASPDDLAGQLEFIRRHWGFLIGKFMARLLTSLDVMKEENKPSFFGPGPSRVLTFEGGDNEYERFSPDQEWMPKTVLIAKSTLVWLFQLSQKYGREISRLDQIPDEELDELSRRGFTGLWLIGLWERSGASKIIKQWTGNPEAAASAYSLYDYDIAGELGGWGALGNLRERCYSRGIRLGSDMVPNHTGIDSKWIAEYPDRFLQLPYPPFPTYNFNCGNLSGRDDITVQIEEHYFTRSDAAVVFKRTDNRTGEVRYIYHGNDGTSMPWNDTAQIDFLNPEAREAVIRTIVGVCQQFSIVRFDAAMTLAKRHIQRLWYPEPGRGGDIASRSEHAISSEEFNRRIPNEFWREVVDRCAAEAPHTLLLAEAFWMMEGYFVRTLGMHRVYNSAFMNMLKNEENAKYRATIKNTVEFDPEILKRFVNFMNNPDEETAVAQFGKGDKYFGICTLMVTMPGLPMFGHGQIEGFEEKYGMEYRRSYRDEKADQGLVDRHEGDIFPLMKKRYLFSGSADFTLYDFYAPEGHVNENVFAYSNRAGDEKALVLYNNVYPQTAGWIKKSSVAIPQKDGTYRQDNLSEALGLRNDDRCFTLFREQRSNLWYIRSSKDLCERGLYVSLNGYGAQVFLDIHEAEDVETGSQEFRWNSRWSKLNASLDGRGVYDLDKALFDAFLEPLYRPLGEFFSPERMKKFYGLFTVSSKTPPAGERKAGEEEDISLDSIGDTLEGISFMDSLREPVLIFADTAEDYLDGAGGRYEAFASPWNYPRTDPAVFGNELAACADRLRLLAQYSIAEAGIPKSAEAFLGSLGREIRRRPEIAALAAGYVALSMLRNILGEGAAGADAAALAVHWRLDRKIREYWENLGIPGDEAWRVMELAKAVLARTCPDDAGAYFTALGQAGGKAKKSAKGALKKLAETLIYENYDNADFRSLLKVNLFEDITWFNKEAFDEALFYVPLFLCLESAAAFTEVIRPPLKPGLDAGKAASPARRKGGKAKKAPGMEETAADLFRRAEILAELTGIFRRAEEQSGYRLDSLLGALSGEKK